MRNSSKDILLERNRFEDEKRWPKMKNIIQGFQAQMMNMLGITNFSEIEGYFNIPLIQSAYREALSIHGQQTREERIGFTHVEYILHVEEALNHFLKFVTQIVRNNPKMRDQLCSNINEYIISVLLHDAIEDFPLPKGQKWNFDAIFEHVTNTISEREPMDEESVEKIHGFVKSLSKDKRKTNKRERNKVYYAHLAKEPDIFVKIIKLSDMLNNFETLDETYVASRSIEKTRQFMDNLYKHVDNNKMPPSLRGNKYLEYSLALIESHDIIPRLQSCESHDSLTDKFTPFELEILSALYLWSKAFGYMLHLEPAGEDPIQLPNGRECIKPDFFTEDEFAIPGVHEIVETLKKAAINPEKAILYSFIETRIQIGKYLDISPVKMQQDTSIAITPRSIKKLSRTRGKQNKRAHRKTEKMEEIRNSIYDSFYGLVADEGSEKKSLHDAHVAIVDNALALLYQTLGKVEIEKSFSVIRDIIDCTRKAVEKVYQRTGLVPPRAKIGPRMGLWIHIKDPGKRQNQKKTHLQR